jgi:xanthine dehydrogenase accessory factor
MSDFFEKVAALARAGESFATATVVSRSKPVSAHLGDRAIVFADGRMEGFIGGACSHEIIRQQAMDAMRARHARLVSIRPDATDASTADPEHVFVPMTCVSEGAVDVFVEPFVPRRRLVVIGATPVAEALARTALSLRYDVVRVVEAGEARDLAGDAAAGGSSIATLDSLETALGTAPGETAVVVASQGHYDEQALEVVLRRGVDYVGLVASRKRGATVRAFLEGNGVPGVDAVRIPAGLDLGARTAPEVAVSILAEIVQRCPSQSIARAESAASRAPEAPKAAPAEPGRDAAAAVDPVCGMTVRIATAKHTADVDGVAYYFCCASCRAKFVQEPARYRSAPA